MDGFDTGDCDIAAPNDDPVPRSLEFTGIQRAVAIVHRLVSEIRPRAQEPNS